MEKNIVLELNKPQFDLLYEAMELHYNRLEDWYLDKKDLEFPDELLTYLYNLKQTLEV